MRKSQWTALMIIFLSFIVGIILYPRLPNEMASHWNVQGRVDGYMPKFWGVFLMPLISSIMFFLFVFLPKTDPIKENIKKNQKYFSIFINSIFIFLFYIYILTLLFNLGYRFDLVSFLIPALAALFYSVGLFMEKIKRNYFFGFRTPWALVNDENWYKTNRLGGKLFQAAALISLLGLVFPKLAFYFFLTPLIIFLLITFIYSYLLFKQSSQ
jgi:uncharacterized membrane protein